MAAAHLTKYIAPILIDLVYLLQWTKLMQLVRIDWLSLMTMSRNKAYKRYLRKEEAESMQRSAHTR